MLQISFNWKVFLVFTSCRFNTETELLTWTCLMLWGREVDVYWGEGEWGMVTNEISLWQRWLKYVKYVGVDWARVIGFYRISNNTQLSSEYSEWIILDLQIPFPLHRVQEWLSMPRWWQVQVYKKFCLLVRLLYFC